VGWLLRSEHPTPLSIGARVRLKLGLPTTSKIRRFQADASGSLPWWMSGDSWPADGPQVGRGAGRSLPPRHLPAAGHQLSVAETEELSGMSRDPDPLGG